MTETMKAFALAGPDSMAPEVLEVPIPEVGTGDVRVRVLAASINGYDAFVASGMARQTSEHRYPVVVGKDLAGVIESVGEGVTRFAPGDEVVGIMPVEPVLWRGSLGEHVVVPAEGFLGPKPANLDFERAGALGLAGLAALVTVEAIDPSEGDAVLVLGATGGVGAFAVQLAAARGASVIATGLHDDEAWLRELGAGEVVDYSADVAAWVRERHPEGVDALIHVVNLAPEALGPIVGLVRDGGKVASTMGAADAEGLASRGVTASNVFGQADPAPFARLLEIAATGALEVPIRDRYALGDVRAGFERFWTGSVRGKIAVSLEG